jgi:hypothetical protein
MGMANIGTREKIVIGVMGVVILYAAVDFLMPKKKNLELNVKQKTEELNTFVTTISAELGAGASADKMGSLLLGSAEKEWTGDPFLDDKSFRAWSKTRDQVKDAVAAPKVEFVYSGYLEVSGKRIAIINGMEYREGEPLEVKGFVLKNISPSNVVIENSKIGAKVNVPLLE